MKENTENKENNKTKFIKLLVFPFCVVVFFILKLIKCKDENKTDASKHEADKE